MNSWTTNTILDNTDTTFHVCLIKKGMYILFQVMQFLSPWVVNRHWSLRNQRGYVYVWHLTTVFLKFQANLMTITSALISAYVTGNFKMLLLLPFWWISSDVDKLHEDIGYYSGIQTWQSANFKSFVALRNFNIEVNGKIIKCAIPWKMADRRAKWMKIWAVWW